MHFEAHQRSGWMERNFLSNYNFGFIAITIAGVANGNCCRQLRISLYSLFCFICSARASFNYLFVVVVFFFVCILKNKALSVWMYSHMMRLSCDSIQRLYFVNACDCMVYADVWCFQALKHNFQSIRCAMVFVFFSEFYDYFASV